MMGQQAQKKFACKTVHQGQWQTPADRCDWWNGPVVSVSESLVSQTYRGRPL